MIRCVFLKLKKSKTFTTFSFFYLKKTFLNSGQVFLSSGCFAFKTRYILVISLKNPSIHYLIDKLIFKV